ncbi:MAG: glycine--tRNA ligase subunit beta [Gammaproteobacteria bacterium]
MSDARDLLVEIGTEELPPKALRRLSEAFTHAVVTGLGQADLAHGAARGYAAPRRLAVLIRDLAPTQPDRVVERRGPAVTAAFDEEGCATKAALGFARSCGVEVEQLEQMRTGQGSWLVFRQRQQGRTAQKLAPEIVTQALERLPIPKRMRWGALEVEFVRPVHWVVLLYGDEAIEAPILGVTSGRETRGHRFHHPQPIYLGEPEAYAPLLETQGHVLADFDERREAIRGQVIEAASGAGGQAVIDAALLDEVTAMVEWPVAVLGAFDQRFLEVPSEALISAMKAHQKYFHLVDGEGHLLPNFVTVSNIESRDPSVVRAGNERVIRPRLADADFFWRQDRKTRLDERLERLADVVFQRKLGSLYDKVQRTIALTGAIATRLGVDKYLAERAAELCKCDLMTDMVGEFPELQGTMGRYYAGHDGEPEEVAAGVGRAVAIADKIDTLVGIFGIGQAPTGDKDPFALRRAAVGLVRILIEQDLELDLDWLIDSAIGIYDQRQPNVISGSVAPEVFDFVVGRLDQYYAGQGYSADEIEAVACLRPSRLNDLDRRLRAVAAFRRLPEAESLAAANKRIANILKKTDEAIPERFDPALVQEDAERVLAERLQELDGTLGGLFDAGDYEGAMQQLARLRAPVDGFFDGVMVMVDDGALRGNRLALLHGLQQRFLRVADVSRLQSRNE